MRRVYYTATGQEFSLTLGQIRARFAQFVGEDIMKLSIEISD
jgi:hypothetical protein